MLEIVVDVREHVLIEKLRGLASESKSTIGISVETLLLGDILLRIRQEPDTTNADAITEGTLLNANTTEILLYERKSFVDLLASIKDGRYEEQSHRLIHSSGMNPHNIVYVLEGIFSTLRNPADKRIILSAMTSLSYFKGFSVFRTATILETAELIWATANKLQKEFANGKLPQIQSSTLSLRSGIAESTSQQSAKTLDSEENIEPIAAYSNFVKKAKRENITPENIGEILLCQIPGISSLIAAEVLKHFGGSFTQLIMEIRTNPEKLEAIYLESSRGKRRKLSSAVIKSILLFLGG
jgi:ERCC4-type nuclease